MARSAGMRRFDAVAVGNRETDAWAAYYRHEWARFLAAAVGMVAAGFGMSPMKTLVGAWHVLRANQLWAPNPSNDPEGARLSMARFYRLVFQDQGLGLDARRAAELEVDWWRLHREHQFSAEVSEDRLVAALANLYGYVYSTPVELMCEAAQHRVQAMNLSDRWVTAGCRRDDPLLAGERLALVASYSALLDAVYRSDGHT